MNEFLGMLSGEIMECADMSFAFGVLEICAVDPFKMIVASSLLSPSMFLHITVFASSLWFVTILASKIGYAEESNRLSLW